MTADEATAALVKTGKLTGQTIYCDRPVYIPAGSYVIENCNFLGIGAGVIVGSSAQPPAKIADHADDAAYYEAITT